MRLTDLLAVGAKIGLLGFGGGYAVLAVIREETVTRRRWLSAEQFDHVIEMTALAPGATTINVLGALGYRFAGLSGMATIVSAVLLPSFFLVLALAASTAAVHVPLVQSALRGVEAAVVGLLVAVLWDLVHDLRPRRPEWVVIALAAILTILDVNPALVVLGGALAGYLSARLFPKSVAKEDHAERR